MTWIQTIPEEDASGIVRELYERVRQKSGHLPAILQAHSIKPELMRAWHDFSNVVTFGGSTLGREREEILAVAIGGMLDCEYCTVAHGEFLRAVSPDQGERDQLVTLATDFRSADIDAADHAMLEYAEKITFAPSSITEEDVEALRTHGFNDQQILEIATIASYRNYISRVADALGVRSEGFRFGEDEGTRNSLV